MEAASAPSRPLRVPIGHRSGKSNDSIEGGAQFGLACKPVADDERFRRTGANPESGEGANGCGERRERRVFATLDGGHRSKCDDVRARNTVPCSVFGEPRFDGVFELQIEPDGFPWQAHCGDARGQIEDPRLLPRVTSRLHVKRATLAAAGHLEGRVQQVLQLHVGRLTHEDAVDLIAKRLEHTEQLDELVRCFVSHPFERVGSMLAFGLEHHAVRDVAIAASESEAELRLLPEHLAVGRPLAVQIHRAVPSHPPQPRGVHVAGIVSGEPLRVAREFRDAERAGVDRAQPLVLHGSESKAVVKALIEHAQPGDGSAFGCSPLDDARRRRERQPTTAGDPTCAYTGDESNGKIVIEIAHGSIAAYRPTLRFAIEFRDQDVAVADVTVKEGAIVLVIPQPPSDFFQNADASCAITRVVVRMDAAA